MTLITTKEAAKRTGLTPAGFKTKADYHGIFPKARLNQSGVGRPTSLYTKTQVHKVFAMSI